LNRTAGENLKKMRVEKVHGKNPQFVSWFFHVFFWPFWDS
jgi:hypothetical protein